MHDKSKLVNPGALYSWRREKWVIYIISISEAETEWWDSMCDNLVGCLWISHCSLVGGLEQHRQGTVSQQDALFGSWYLQKCCLVQIMQRLFDDNYFAKLLKVGWNTSHVQVIEKTHVVCGRYKRHWQAGWLRCRQWPWRWQWLKLQLCSFLQYLKFDHQYLHAENINYVTMHINVS